MLDEGEIQSPLTSAVVTRTQLPPVPYWPGSVYLICSSPLPAAREFRAFQPWRSSEGHDKLVCPNQFLASPLLATFAFPRTGLSQDHSEWLPGCWSVHTITNRVRRSLEQSNHNSLNFNPFTTFHPTISSSSKSVFFIGALVGNPHQLVEPDLVISTQDAVAILRRLHAIHAQRIIP